MKHVSNFLRVTAPFVSLALIFISAYYELKGEHEKAQSGYLFLIAINVMKD